MTYRVVLFVPFGGSKEPAKAEAEEGASGGSEGKAHSAGEALAREYPPHVEAAEDHEDQAGCDCVHGECPHGG